MIMPDKYDNFKKLQENEAGNFEIECIDRGSHITIIAPHGGKIERKTTKIAKRIAGDSLNYYSFIGKKNSYNRDLHITSHKFDEPRALELVVKSEIIITIHGCANKWSKIDDNREIFIGGLDEGLISKFKDAMKDEFLPISFLKKFSGTEKKNICNRGINGKGVQFELTKAFREDVQLTNEFISNVRTCLEKFEKKS
ncbi:MAG: Unknown protein [uncultured Sulfurovum sp.]|uniref:Replication protein n=1 Tax=uncultured Sulfurovum sp. TaxID=269237 RepID=A0A6S6TWX5_9BACT|nr:MAG: Unknown protein [uncultured Sulfurovum sp.]